jgi:hypothetical protein
MDKEVVVLNCLMNTGRVLDKETGIGLIVKLDCCGGNGCIVRFGDCTIDTELYDGYESRGIDMLLVDIELIGVLILL